MGTNDIDELNVRALGTFLPIYRTGGEPAPLHRLVQLPGKGDLRRAASSIAS